VLKVYICLFLLFVGLPLLPVLVDVCPTGKDTHIGIHQQELVKGAFQQKEEKDIYIYIYIYIYF
jgi:hypothetical protein